MLSLWPLCGVDVTVCLLSVFLWCCPSSQRPRPDRATVILPVRRTFEPGRPDPYHSHPWGVHVRVPVRPPARPPDGLVTCTGILHGERHGIFN